MGQHFSFLNSRLIELEITRQFYLSLFVTFVNIIFITSSKSVLQVKVPYGETYITV